VQPHQSYTQGGPIAARFLQWAELHTRLDLVDQLHHALQTGQSFSAVLRRLTHETVDDLWSQYQAQPAITPTPDQSTDHHRREVERLSVHQRSVYHEDR
jgi:hypothetical protein